MSSGTQDKADLGQIAALLLPDTRQPVQAVEALRERADLMDHALNQIQTIAYDGTLGNLEDKAVEAAFQRIVNIAEAQKPDEDWRPHQDRGSVR